jgi:hypothetical protein
MTRKLRRAHRRTWLFLAVLLPLLLASALWNRTETTPRNPGFTWGEAQ